VTFSLASLVEGELDCIVYYLLVDIPELAALEFIADSLLDCVLPTLTRFEPKQVWFMLRSNRLQYRLGQSEL
jgi:hypothetical protein